MRRLIESLERRALLAATPAPTLSIEGFGGQNAPNDSAIAAGPEHVVIVANDGVRFYTKSGVKLYEASLAEFFQDIAGEIAAGHVFDPRVVYDTHAGRFVISASNRRTEGSRLLVAASNDQDPTDGALTGTEAAAVRRGSWERLAINTNDESAVPSFQDFPVVAISSDAIFITSSTYAENPFTQPPPAGEDGYRLWIIHKPRFVRWRRTNDSRVYEAQTSDGVGSHRHLRRIANTDVRLGGECGYVPK